MVPVRLAVEPSRMVGVRAEDDDADVVGFEVERHALDAAVELDHLAGLDVVEAVDAGDAVADRQHGADFGDLRVGVEIRDLVADDAGNFSGADIHIQPFIASASLLSLVRMDASIIWLPSLIDDPTEDFRVDARFDRHVAAGASTELLLEGRELVVLERMRGHDLGSGLTAMLGGEAAERADHVLKLVLAAVPGEHAEEVGRDRIERELLGDCRERLPGLRAVDQRARQRAPRNRANPPAPAPEAQGSGPPRRSAVRREPGRTKRTHSAPLS